MIPDKRFLKWYVLYNFTNLILLMPAYAVNLLTVYLLINNLSLTHLWIFPAVTVGDVIAWVINVQFSVYLQIHWKWLHRLQDESKEVLRRSKEVIQ